MLASVLASSVVERVVERILSQTKDYKIDICCFSTKHGKNILFDKTMILSGFD